LSPGDAGENRFGSDPLRNDDDVATENANGVGAGQKPGMGDPVAAAVLIMPQDAPPEAATLASLASADIASPRGGGAAVALPFPPIERDKLIRIIAWFAGHIELPAPLPAPPPTGVTRSTRPRRSALPSQPVPRTRPLRGWEVAAWVLPLLLTIVGIWATIWDAGERKQRPLPPTATTTSERLSTGAPKPSPESSAARASTTAPPRSGAAAIGEPILLARYRDEFLDRLRQISGDQPDIRTVGSRFVFQSEVLFAPGSTELGDGAKKVLAPVIIALKEISAKIPPEIDWILRVDSHTDGRPIGDGQPRSNWELSVARAISVVRFALDEGVPAARLDPAGFADQQPLDPRGAEDAYRRNRRIELELTGRSTPAFLARYRSEFFGRLREILGDRPDIRVGGDRFVFQSEVLFAPGSAELSDDAKKELAPLIAALREISPKIPPDINWILGVEGHSDRRPVSNTRFASNWELSAARAISVVRFAIDEGVPAARLAAAAFADQQPIDPRMAEDAYRRNRRIELKLIEWSRPPPEASVGFAAAEPPFHTSAATRPEPPPASTAPTSAALSAVTGTLASVTGDEILVKDAQKVWVFRADTHTEVYINVLRQSGTADMARFLKSTVTVQSDVPSLRDAVTPIRAARVYLTSPIGPLPPRSISAAASSSSSLGSTPSSVPPGPTRGASPTRALHAVTGTLASVADDRIGVKDTDRLRYFSIDKDTEIYAGDVRQNGLIYLRSLLGKDVIANSDAPSVLISDTPAHAARVYVNSSNKASPPAPSGTVTTASRGTPEPTPASPPPSPPAHKAWPISVGQCGMSN